MLKFLDYTHSLFDKCFELKKEKSDLGLIFKCSGSKWLDSTAVISIVCTENDDDMTFCISSTIADRPLNSIDDTKYQFLDRHLKVSKQFGRDFIREMVSDLLLKNLDKEHRIQVANLAILLLSE